ncbi:protein SERAC1-like [Amphiura filiformis]|uniref:protein SERAC1-like n=1 Tax=Amphiura filiformis TaxID=82378 RepID=UPI003B2178BA
MNAKEAVRLFSSQRAIGKTGKYLTLVAFISACGAGVIYREWLKLQKAVHFKTDSVPDKHAKSYIYITSESTDDLVTQVKKNVHWNLAVLEHFLEDRGIGWLPFERRIDDPWRLLRRAQSKNRCDRLAAVSALASKHHWNDSEYRAVAQACDQRTLIGLARSHDVDFRFFLPPPPPPVQASEETLQDALCDLVGSLPRSNIDKCTEFFTTKAMREGHHAVAADHQSGALVFGGTPFSFVTGLSRQPQETQEMNYLLALLSHSEVLSHCVSIVENGGLPVLMRCYLERGSSKKMQCHIAHIIANLSVHEKLHNCIVQAGWVTVLAKWMKSNVTPLASHAARALANLDRDSCKEKYDDGVYVLHPQTRKRAAYEADVVFVHGLMGGAFHTWRQQDQNSKREKAPSKNGVTSNGKPSKTASMIPTKNVSKEKYTDCWPKSWLSEDIPHMRILTVSYESHITEWAAKCPYGSEKRSLGSRSAELLRKLHKAGVGERPIIWVTHSMGGLLVKQMLVDACDKPDFDQLIENSHGIVFFSTPHHGASLAAMSQQAQFLLYPTVEVKELTQGSQFLKNLHGRFRAFVQTYQIPVLSFGEKEPTNIGLSIKTFIVPKMSSHPGFGEYHTLDVNHLDICKPADRNSLLYVILVRFIMQNVTKALHKSLAEILTRDLFVDEAEELFYPLGFGFGE